MKQGNVVGKTAKLLLQLLIGRLFVHILCIHSFLQITLEVLFVEAHGRDYGACGPIYHDICQEVIQAELPVQM